MSTATDELINAYLAELEREAARLPWNARTELLEDVRSHIEVAVAEIRAAAGRGSAAAGGPDGAAELGSDGEVGLSLGDGALQSPADAPSAESSPGIRADADEVAQVRAMLAALGEPSEIVAAALADDPFASAPPSPADPTSELYPAGPDLYRPPTRQSAPYPLGTAEVGAIALLLLGGFIAGIGWVMGAVLLWTSTRWTRLEKLIGTLVLPGGIAGGLLTFTSARGGSYGRCDGAHCVTVHTGWNPPGWLFATLIAISVLAPAATAVFLVNRARLRPGIAPASSVALAIIAGVGTLGVLAAVGLVAVSSSSGRVGHATPAPLDYSGDPVSGYVVPVSSPAQPVSSASTP
jgi:hypothetical protein